MPSAPAFVASLPSARGVAEDAISALLNLGYRRQEVQPVVATVADRLGEAAALDALIRDSLKELAQRASGG